VIDRRFDLVFCPQGPMPPLAPAEFLRLVRGRLTESGSVNLTVGGRHGRLGVTLFRRLIETAGIDLEAAEAPAVRQWVSALPESHPFRAAADSPEAASDEGLLELLRAGEPAFSIPELGALLAESGLHLQRFLCQAHYMPACNTPGSNVPGSNVPGFGGLGAAAGAAADAYEDAGPFSSALSELLRGNLREHIVIACRDDRLADSYRVSFAGRDWLDYKPVRNPGLEIEAGPFPDGGVARLSWAAHENRGISLVVDEKQARLFDLIDGARPIAEIVQAASLRGVDAEGLARAFFHSLWLRDYAWFQTPAVSVGPAASENPSLSGHSVPLAESALLEGFAPSESSEFQKNPAQRENEH
jgi:hypothetical protein